MSHLSSIKIDNLSFCPTCNNLLYYKNLDNVGGDGTPVDPGVFNIVSYCKKCQYMSRIDPTKEIIEFNSANIDIEKLSRQRFSNNKFLKYDNTLPRIKMDCPKCNKKEATGLYIEYDSENMNNLYMCLECEQITN